MFTMKVVVAISALGAVSAYSNNAFAASKRAFTPLTMLPKSTSTSTAEKVFFPFEESSTALQQGPNNEAEDGSAGVRQLLGVKGASAETNIWKIRLQLTKVGMSTRYTVASLSFIPFFGLTIVMNGRSLSRGFHLYGE